jgi:transcriptional regulator with XRE-family HTH domain
MSTVATRHFGESLEGAVQLCFNGDFGIGHWQVPFCGLQVELRLTARPVMVQVTPTERGVTEVPNPTVPRRELGVRLRALRTERGMTVEQVARELLCSPSKISRLETGHRGASARDIRDLSQVYGLDGEEQQYLTDLAAEGKLEAWWGSLDVTFNTYVGLEAAADSIKDFGLGLIPGLLQTREYAEAIMRAFVPHHSEEAIEVRVGARLRRQQQVLYEANTRDFHAILEEAVLRRVVGSPQVMRAQLQQLVNVSELPGVSVQVIRFEAGALPVANNKFIILGFARTDLKDVVFVEGLTGDLYLDEAEDVRIYGAAFRELQRLAQPASQTRSILMSLLRSYR